MNACLMCVYEQFQDVRQINIETFSSVLTSRSWALPRQPWEVPRIPFFTHQDTSIHKTGRAMSAISGVAKGLLGKAELEPQVPFTDREEPTGHSLITLKVIGSP